LCNLTPTPIEGLQVCVQGPGYWHEIVNSDAAHYGGSGVGNYGGVHANSDACGDCSHSLYLTLPPLAVVFLSDRPLQVLP